MDCIARHAHATPLASAAKNGSGEALRTSSVCPLRVNRSRQASRSHTLTVRSLLPLACPWAEPFGIADKTVYVLVLFPPLSQLVPILEHRMQPVETRLCLSVLAQLAMRHGQKRQLRRDQADDDMSVRLRRLSER